MLPVVAIAPNLGSVFAWLSGVVISITPSKIVD
jgi:hypothetical protein